MCNRLTDRCEQLNMDITDVVVEGNIAFLQWTMTMMFKKFPSTPVYGCSKLTFAEDNRILHQRDYFDLWGDIFNGIPCFKPCIVNSSRNVSDREKRCKYRKNCNSWSTPGCRRDHRRAARRQTLHHHRGHLRRGLRSRQRFAAGGADIVMVVRNPEKADKVRDELIQAYGVRVDVVLADFSKLPEVRKAAAEVLDRFPKIDILINNAGVHRTKLSFTEAGFETVFGVNHLASFLFTRLLLDRVIASAPARIIQVNSEGHRFSTVHLDDLSWEHHRYTGLKSYGAARTAQLLTVWELAERLAGTGVTINAMHPGAVRSNLGMDRQNDLFYRVYKRYFLSLFLKPPEISGEALYTLGAAPEMAEVTGKFFNLTIEEKPPPTHWTANWDNGSGLSAKP